MPIHCANGPVHEIVSKLLGERFSCIEVRSFAGRPMAVLQALHEFESDYGVIIEEFNFDPLLVGNDFRLYLKHSIIANQGVTFPIHSY